MPIIEDKKIEAARHASTMVRLSKQQKKMSSAWHEYLGALDEYITGIHSNLLVGKITPLSDTELETLAQSCHCFYHSYLPVDRIDQRSDDYDAFSNYVKARLDPWYLLLQTGKENPCPLESVRDELPPVTVLPSHSKSIISPPSPRSAASIDTVSLHSGDNIESAEIITPFLGAVPSVSSSSAERLVISSITKDEPVWLENLKRPFEEYKRKREANSREYFLFGHWAGSFSKTQKISAVDKLLNALTAKEYPGSFLDYDEDKISQEDEVLIFKKTELMALHQGRLGKAVAQLHAKIGHQTIFMQRLKLDHYIATIMDRYGMSVKEVRSLRVGGLITNINDSNDLKKVEKKGFNKHTFLEALNLRDALCSRSCIGLQTQVMATISYLDSSAFKPSESKFLLDLAKTVQTILQESSPAEGVTVQGPRFS